MRYSDRTKGSWKCHQSSRGAPLSERRHGSRLKRGHGGICPGMRRKGSLSRRWVATADLVHGTSHRVKNGTRCSATTKKRSLGRNPETSDTPERRRPASGSPLSFIETAALPLSICSRPCLRNAGRHIRDGPPCRQVQQNSERAANCSRAYLHSHRRML